MTEFVIRRSIQRYRELLKAVTNERDRLEIARQLAEEQAKLGAGAAGRVRAKPDGRHPGTYGPGDDDPGPAAA